MGYETAIVVGVLGISFLLTYIGSQLPKDNFMNWVRFLFWGVSLWILLFIPAYNFHLLDSFNETSTNPLANGTYVKISNVATSQYSIVMWSLIVVTVLFFIYAIWALGLKMAKIKPRRPGRVA